MKQTEIGYANCLASIEVAKIKVAEVCARMLPVEVIGHPSAAAIDHLSSLFEEFVSKRISEADYRRALLKATTATRIPASPRHPDGRRSITGSLHVRVS